MQQQMPANQTNVVMALGKQARRLSWFYAVYVIYYAVIAVLVARHGIRWSGVGQVAHDLVRLSNLVLPLFAYIVVNGALVASLRFFISLHPVARWGVAITATVLAMVSLGLNVLNIVKAVGRPGAAAVSWSLFLSLGLAAGHVVLAILVTWLTRRLNQYAQFEGRWLSRRTG